MTQLPSQTPSADTPDASMAGGQVDAFDSALESLDAETSVASELPSGEADDASAPQMEMDGNPLWSEEGGEASLATAESLEANLLQANMLQAPQVVYPAKGRGETSTTASLRKVNRQISSQQQWRQGKVGPIAPADQGDDDCGTAGFLADVHPGIHQLWHSER